jgi:hypothetical protein
MRTLNNVEAEHVSGGEWHLDFDLGFINGGFSGPESVQQVVGGAYYGAVDAMADFFTWWDPAGYYDSGCGGSNSFGGR